MLTSFVIVVIVVLLVFVGVLVKITHEGKPAQEQEDTLPAQMEIGGRTYDVLSFVYEGEGYVDGDIIVAISKEMGASSTNKHGRFIHKNQSYIPAALRGEVYFVFADWRSSDGGVMCLYWNGRRWCERWFFYGYLFRRCRVVRLVPTASKKKAA